MPYTKKRTCILCLQCVLNVFFFKPLAMKITEETSLMHRVSGPCLPTGATNQLGLERNTPLLEN